MGAELTLQDIIKAVKAAPYSFIKVGNPPGKLVSGYEYRTVPCVKWAKEVPMDPEVAALAWCLSSEAPDIKKYPQYSVAIAETVCNAGIHLVTKDRRAAVDGKFGRQSGRWCASYEPPTLKHTLCALMAIDRRGEENLLARGAVQWLDCKTQIAMNKKKPATNPPPEVVLKARYHVGRKWIGPVDGIDPFRLMMFGPKGVSYAEAKAALAAGRKQWKL